MTVSAVVVCSVSNVSPALPTPQTHRHILTNLDLLLSDLLLSTKTYTKQVYYYPFAGVGHVSLEDLGSGFKQSLSKALAEYPLLAGRICENGHKLEIDCNDKGVPFVLAFTDTSFSDWEGGVKNSPLERELVPSETYIKEYSEAPLIKAQLTRFKCGGVALGFVTCEIALDGFSGPEFVKSWSEIHRGLPLTRPPLFYAPLLEPRSPPHVTITPSRDFKSSPALTLNYKVFENTSMYINRVFSFSEEQVNKLVREVDTGPFSYGSASSFEALVALSWKAITEVRELPDSEVTTLNYAVSLRGKKVFNPPVPPNYFGNCAHIPCLPAKCSEVKTNHISYVARLLRQDINSFTTEYIKSSIDWMELELQKGNEIGFNCDLNSGKDINCTSLHTFPIYGADFRWGKPAHFSLLLHPWYGNGVVFVLPTPLGDRSRQVLVSLPAKQMKKLVAHELFAKFAS